MQVDRLGDTGTGRAIAIASGMERQRREKRSVGAGCREWNMLLFHEHWTTLILTICDTSQLIPEYLLFTLDLFSFCCLQLR